MSNHRLPVFPLNLPLLPGCVMPLQIFEKRYLDMVSACMRTQTGFVVSLLHQGAEQHEVIRPHQDTPSDIPFFATGTLAKIIDFGQRENGLLAITIEGESLQEISQIEQNDDGLWMADAIKLEEFNKPGEEDIDALKELLGSILSLPNTLPETVKIEELSSVQIMNYLIMLLPIPTPTKQKLLQQNDLASRWALLHDMVLSTLD